MFDVKIYGYRLNFNKLNQPKCLLVAKRHDRALILVGAVEGSESVVGYRVVVTGIDSLCSVEVMVNDVKRRAFTVREVTDQIRMVDAEGTGKCLGQSGIASCSWTIDYELGPLG